MSTERITLRNVRMSFPFLFQKESFNGQPGDKYAATFLLDPEEHASELEAINSMIDEKLIEKYGSLKKVPPVLKKEDKRCLKDGDATGYDGYEGMMSIKAANKARPSTMDRRKQQVTEEDNLFYSGCYVDASIDIWIMDNQHGKRILGNLYAVRFRRDGEPFTGGMVPTDVEDDFDDLDDDDDLDNDDI